MSEPQSHHVESTNIKYTFKLGFIQTCKAGSAYKTQI